MNNQSKMLNILKEANLINIDQLKVVSEKTRDRNDVKVYQCLESKVIFLDVPPKMTEAHYESFENFAYWGKDRTRQDALKLTSIDDNRRFNSFKTLITGKKILDVGTGLGGFIELVKKSAKSVSAVEIQPQAAQALRDLGYTVHKRLHDAENDYDVITLFHVLEHMFDPIGELKIAKNKLKKGGKIVIEVPHALDALLELYRSKPFADFTFWSEHLILHTEKSLTRFLELAGFENIKVEGFQRYNLANHLYWLSKGEPGGHDKWKMMGDVEMNEKYTKTLIDNKLTDTIIATATV